MPFALLALLALLLLFVLIMQAWRLSESKSISDKWDELRASSPKATRIFDPVMVQHLPEPARRYFLFTIAPGTPLQSVSEIRMAGEIGLGNQENPNYQPMQARQILAPPHGFIWRLDAGSGVMKISGSDGMFQGQSWTRFWFNWTVPVVRSGGDENHLRASFGRVVAEAVFWSPASLLPGDGVRWEKGNGPGRAKATVTQGSLTQLLEIEVGEDGRPKWVMLPRWSNANPEKTWRLQPFGGTLDDFRSFGGYTLPTKVDGGNHFGTKDYFPFFQVRIEEIRFR